MKNKRRDRLALTVAVLLAVALLTACAQTPGQQDAAPDPEQTAQLQQEIAAPKQEEPAALVEQKSAMLADWKACLAVTDEVYSQLLWSLDYAAAFASEDSWDSLLKARAACGAAELALQQLQLPEQTLTQEQSAALMDAGIEADIVRKEFEGLDTMRLQNLDTLSALKGLLKNDVYLTASVQMLPAWIADCRQVIQLQCQYLCLMSNGVLLQVGSDELWGQMETELPTLAAARGEWYSDEQLLQAACTDVLDALEKQISDRSETLGVSEYTLKLVQEAADTGELDRLSAQINVMDGVPAYFPQPSWLPNDAAQYDLVTDDESGEKRFVVSGEQILQTPSASYLSCSGVDSDAVEQYALRLTQWGLEVYAEWNETGDTYQVFSFSGESAMLVEWTQEQTSIYLTQPVGCLIPELYLAAMRAD